ncbi:DYW family of nucleic acid deaminases-domain-containing protein [Hypoxylon sp. FL1150]|nr:DYW family of nucleic acid deaminases-domain-containing protein [Hypoxylon sp. FL1150]
MLHPNAMASETQTADILGNDGTAQGSSQLEERIRSSSVSHGNFEGDSAVEERYASHCAEDENGNRNPASNGEAQCEAKTQRSLVTLDAASQTEQPSGDKVDQSKEGLHQVVKGGSESLTNESIMTAVAKMKEGDYEYVQQYLKYSPKRDIFLYANEETWKRQEYNSVGLSNAKLIVKPSGDTALHIAARGAYPNILKLLLDKGANPDVMNLKGRTPLAESALWGRLENVRVLVDYGANQELECTGNARPVFAVDYARDLQANEGERAIHPEDCYHTLDDDFAKRGMDIVLLLMSSQASASHITQSFAYAKSPTDPASLTLLACFDLSNKWKTIGALYSKSPLSIVTAMSGWAHHAMNTRISGGIWTAQVMELCKAIGHKLQPIRAYDQDMPGRFNASHAEKQLIAFFIRENQLSPRKVDETLDFEKLTLEESSDEEYSRSPRTRESVEPLTSLKKATILVFREICPDCRFYITKVNEFFGVEISVFHRCLEPDCRGCNSGFSSGYP